MHVDDAPHGRRSSRGGVVEGSGQAVRDVLPGAVAAAVVGPEESASDGPRAGLGDGEDVAVCVGARAGPGEVGDGGRGGDLREKIFFFF